MRIVVGLGVVLAVLFVSRLNPAIDLLRFPLAWIGVVVALDGAARVRRGGPTLRGGDLVALAAASILFWDVFELLDLRLRNWWYVGVPSDPWWRGAFSAVSFATVLPATRLFISVVTPEEPAAPAPRGKAWPFFAAGVAMLLLACAFPRYAFPLAWIFLWPLCEGALRAFPDTPGLPSPASDRSFALRLAGIALPMGLLWEGLNWGCARGWIYTVPFFDRPKLFEMPLPGYLGYLPFFLECGAALALLDRLRPFLRGGRGAAAFGAVLLLHFAVDRACSSTAISTNDGDRAAIRGLIGNLSR